MGIEQSMTSKKDSQGTGSLGGDNSQQRRPSRHSFDHHGSKLEYHGAENKGGSLGRFVNRVLHRTSRDTPPRQPPPFNSHLQDEDEQNNKSKPMTLPRQPGNIKVGISPDDLEYLSEQTQLSNQAIFDIFAKFSQELDHTTELDKEQFVRLYCSLRAEGEEKMKKIAEFAFHAFDRDKNGKIDFKEFIIAFSLTTRGNLRDKLNYTFDMYDVDSSGYVEVGEIRRVLDAMLSLLEADSQSGTSESIAQECLKILDTHKDGRITRGENI
jgi:Ca2+-binding EF-hand superfamily protein